MTRFVRAGLTAAALWAIVALPAFAQTSLEQVERLTRMGRADEARVMLTEWWDSDRENANRRELQRGLWLRGRLTVDPVQAELDFRRLAVLYPSGQFTPDAILRLAQASWAMGDEPEARAYLASLERDYPRSDVRERAAAWLAVAGPVPPPGDTPTPVVVEEGVPERVARADSAEAEPPSPTEDVGPEDEPEPDPVMNYFVQLGAFADDDLAFALYDEVSAAGVDVRVVHVQGSRFTHVRVGRFAEREAAVELLEELIARGISAALVRDDRVEEPAGRQ